MAAPGFGLPADPAVRFVLDHVVVHLIVAEVGEVHLHHEDVSHARDHRGRTRSPQTLRAIELRVPRGIGQDLEDVMRWSTDPPRYGNRLVLIVSHEIRFLPWGSRLQVRRTIAQQFIAGLVQLAALVMGGI